jgi:hypothetical protein
LARGGRYHALLSTQQLEESIEDDRLAASGPGGTLNQ